MSTPDPIELLSRFQREMLHQATTNMVQRVRTLQYNPKNEVRRLKASKSTEYEVVYTVYNDSNYIFKHHCQQTLQDYH